MDYDLGSGRTIVSIEDDWKVLDVGSGHWPFLKAAACVDLYLDDSTNQRTASLEKTRKLVCADGCELPFRDGTFDYCIAVNVAEHVVSPDKFCREIMRVSRAGYLETPSKLQEILTSTKDEVFQSAHLWYVYLVRNVLIFEKIRKHAPFGNFFRDLFFSDSLRPKFLEAVYKSRDLFWTRLQWRGEFEFRVVEDPDFDCYF